MMLEIIVTPVLNSIGVGIGVCIGQAIYRLYLQEWVEKTKKLHKLIEKASIKTTEG